jgi:hypothetical protein
LRWSFGQWLVIGVAYMGIYQFSQPQEWFVPGADPLLLALWGTQFYLVGIAMQKGLISIRAYGIPVLVVCAATAVAAKFMTPTNMQFIGQAFYLLAACLVLLLITDKTDWSFSMGRDTMGIYLVHAPLIVWGAAVSVSTLLAPFPVTAFVATTVLSVLLSWVAARLMSHTWVGRILLGQSASVERRS